MFNKEDPTIVELTLPFRMRGMIVECSTQPDTWKMSEAKRLCVWNRTLYVPSVRGTYVIQKEGPVEGRYRCGVYMLNVEDVISIIANSETFYQCPDKVLDILCNKRVEVESSIEMGALKQYGVKPAVWDSSGTETLECTWVKEEWVTEEGKVSFPCTVVLESTERHAALRAIRYTLETAE